MNATAQASILEHARREQTQHAEQLDLGLFSHLLERMPLLMRPDQVSRAIGWSRRTIYRLCDVGLLEEHALPDRKKERKQITRRSVAVVLLRTAKYQAADFPALLSLCLPTMTAGQLSQLQFALTGEITKRKPTTHPQ